MKESSTTACYISTAGLCVVWPFLPSFFPTFLPSFLSSISSTYMAPMIDISRSSSARPLEADIKLGGCLSPCIYVYIRQSISSEEAIHRCRACRARFRTPVLVQPPVNGETEAMAATCFPRDRASYGQHHTSAGSTCSRARARRCQSRGNAGRQTNRHTKYMGAIALEQHCEWDTSCTRPNDEHGIEASSLGRTRSEGSLRSSPRCNAPERNIGQELEFSLSLSTGNPRGSGKVKVVDIFPTVINENYLYLTRETDKRSEMRPGGD